MTQTTSGDRNIEFVFGQVSDPGRSGKNNEDHHEVGKTFFVGSGQTTADHAIPFAIVADGIGGSTSGELASRIAVSTATGILTQEINRSLADRLEMAVQRANLAIYNRALEDPSRLGMGTTIVVAAIDGDLLRVAHVGDSRAYLIRDGRAHQLTIDHSWAQEAIEAGRLTPQEARSHPNRHVIKRYLGVHDQLEVDHRLIEVSQQAVNFDDPTTWSMTNSIRLQPGDVVLLCSDGLTDVVSDKQIAQVVVKRAPQAAAKRLVEMANAAGGPDNITVVIMPAFGKPASGVAGRSPLIAGGLMLAALLLVVVGWLLLRQPAGEVATEMTPTGVAAAVQAATPLAVAAAATEPSIEVPTDTATPTPEPTASATATPTETSSPTATETPGETSAVQDIVPRNTISVIQSIATPIPAAPINTPTAMRSPTSTPVTRTTPTPTETATATITQTPKAPKMVQTSVPAPPASTQTSVATRTPVAETNTSPDSFPSVTLISPSDNDTLDGNRLIDFKWESSGPLPEGFQYELIFWKVGEDGETAGKSPVGAKPGLTAPVNLGSVDSTLDDIVDPGKQTRWGVRVWDTAQNKPGTLLSGVRTFTFSGGGSSSGGSGGGNIPSPTDTPEQPD
jgi:serine/threonine protein phosphatase PrpC/outer membrane biosynthesis protein TonB